MKVWSGVFDQAFLIGGFFSLADTYRVSADFQLKLADKLTGLADINEDSADNPLSLADTPSLVLESNLFQKAFLKK